MNCRLVRKDEDILQCYVPGDACHIHNCSSNNKLDKIIKKNKNAITVEKHYKSSNITNSVAVHSCLYRYRLFFQMIANT